MKANNRFLNFLEQDDRNVLLDQIKNGDTKALDVMDSLVTDKMQDVRNKIREKFRAIFIKKKKRIFERNVASHMHDQNLHLTPSVDSLDGGRKDIG